jgi:hypothetical protein
MDNVLKWDTYSATSGSKMVDCASTAARSVGRVISTPWSMIIMLSLTNLMPHYDAHDYRTTSTDLFWRASKDQTPLMECIREDRVLLLDTIWRV